MRRIAVLGLVVAIMACSNDSTSPSGSVAGTYTLQTINGTALPYTFSSPNGSVVLESDVLTLFSNGTYTDVPQYSPSQGSSTENGTWSNNNGSITFDDQTDGIEYQGSVSGTVLTEFVSGFTEVYHKS
jgi:hypothetical protein